MHRSRHGYTLIEMMIAISLGLAIIYTAFSGFRVASQSTTIANRLSLENSLLRAGFMGALNEVDFWLAYDDPNDGNKEQLRADGLQFCNFKTAFPASGLSTNPPSYPGSESDRGWDSNYQWPASDPRTWWRGNMAEHSNTDLRMGSYALFGDTASSATHTWLYNQMHGLKVALGYQGFCEYLPANTIYAYISSNLSLPVNAGKMVQEFISLGGSPNFRTGDGGTNFAQGRYRCTKDTSYGIFPLNPLGGPSFINYYNNSRQFFATGVGASTGSVTDFMMRALSTQDLIDQRLKPQNWPNISMNVARYMTYDRFACMCKIRWGSPLTGEVIELSFNGFGTTLRGARQQRLPGATGSAPGWAHWYGTGDPRNTQNLDSF